MYCTHCGKQLSDQARFCSYCGASLQAEGAAPAPARLLVRPRAGRKIAGIAAGFALYLDMDPTLVRVLLILLAVLSGGLVIVAYLIAWFIIPEEEPGAGTVSIETR